MDQAPAVARGGVDLAELKERVARSTEALNAGDPEPLLASYADDVVVVSPLADREDPATDFVLHGKAAYRNFLLTFLEFHGGFEITGLALDEAGQVVVAILTRSGERKQLVVTLDEEGRGTRAVVFAVA